MRTAGAFGFTRAEIGGLLVMGLLAATLIIGQWARRRASEAIPPWVAEDIVVDSMRVVAGHTEAGGARLEDAPDEIDDPGRVLVDINTAGRDELIRLPGIGPALANRIIAARTADGPFQSLVDLQRVRGIGPKKAAMLAGWVRFSRPLKVKGPAHAADSDSAEHPR